MVYSSLTIRILNRSSKESRNFTINAQEWGDKKFTIDNVEHEIKKFCENKYKMDSHYWRDGRKKQRNVTIKEKKTREK